MNVIVPVKLAVSTAPLIFPDHPLASTTHVPVTVLAA